MKIFLVVLGFFLIFGLMFGCSAYKNYNNMVTLEEKVISQWSQVENVYQRRMDLIPNIVATVKGYAAHEQKTLTAVIEARSKATQVTLDPSNLTEQNMANFQSAQDGLSQTLSRLMVVSERYPELKANQSFLQLQSQLEETENGIALQRELFNETAKEYNTYVKKFPANIWAGLFDFEAKAYFKADEAASKAPVVSFDDPKPVELNDSME